MLTDKEIADNVRHGYTYALELFAKYRKGYIWDDLLLLGNILGKKDDEITYEYTLKRNELNENN